VRKSEHILQSVIETDCSCKHFGADAYGGFEPSLTLLQR
jgi:hypothetical protein